MRNVTNGARLNVPIDIAALDSNLDHVMLLNDDFEQAELHPHYARFEHTQIQELTVGSYVVCDLLDHTKVYRLSVYGDATIRYDASSYATYVQPVGRLTILGCEIEYLDVSGTAIVTHSHIKTVNLRAGGRLFHYGTKIDSIASCDRQIAEGKIKLDDPYVLNLLAMNEFNYMYG